MGSALPHTVVHPRAAQLKASATTPRVVVGAACTTSVTQNAIHVPPVLTVNTASKLLENGFREEELDWSRATY